jgi:outer membrane immunogenic protein
MKKYTLSLLAGIAALGFASVGYAADLIIDAPVVEPGIVNVGGNWDGPYVGVFAGYGWGTADHANDTFPPPCDPDGCDVDLGGWLLGVTAGANFTVGSGFVLGVAGDIAWSNAEGTDDFGGIVGEVSNGVDWEGSVRGVAGFDGGAFMPYLTAGFAVAHAWHESNLGDGEGDATHIGWTAGVGVAFAVADNVSLDLQYRHSWYDEQEYDMDDMVAPNPIFGLQTDRVTLGVNMSF